MANSPPSRPDEDEEFSACLWLESDPLFIRATYWTHLKGRIVAHFAVEANAARAVEVAT